MEVTDYYSYSLEWLRVSDCMLVLPGWESSIGVRQEINEALKVDIPIFYSKEKLYQWRENGKAKD